MSNDKERASNEIRTYPGSMVALLGRKSYYVVEIESGDAFLVEPDRKHPGESYFKWLGAAPKKLLDTIRKK